MSRLHRPLPALCAGFALVVACLLGPHLWDDAYITLRYARSIAAGQGFVYNPGEHVLGTTTPLFTLLLAFLHAAFGTDLEVLAFALAVTGHAITAGLVAMLGRRCGLPICGALAATLYALAPLALGPVLGGMETSLFTAAALAALMPAMSTVGAGHSLAAAVAVLLRPEGALVALLRVLASARAGFPVARRSAALIAVCTLPWFLFATWYFGSPLTHSMTAKWANAARHLSPWRASEWFLYLLLSLPVSAPMPALGLPWRTTFGRQIAFNLPLSASLAIRHGLVLVSAAVMITVLVVGARTLCTRRRDCVWTLLFACLYAASYCLADPDIFAWYLTPPLPIALLTFLAGGTAIVSASVHDPRRRRWLLASLGVALLALATRQVRRLERMPQNGREQAYQRAVAAVGDAAQSPRTVIGAFEIGAVGYYSRARIVDYYGLVTPGLAGTGVAEMIGAYHPDYVIVHQGLAALEGVLRDARFLQDYTKAGTVDASGGFVRSEIQIWQRVQTRPTSP